MDTEKTRELFGELEQYNYGCSRGRMDAHWQFMMDHGAMSIKNYFPYVKVERECEHDFDKVYGKVASYKAFHGMDSVETMMEEVVG